MKKIIFCKVYMKLAIIFQMNYKNIFAFINTIYDELKQFINKFNIQYDESKQLINFNTNSNKELIMNQNN